MEIITKEIGFQDKLNSTVSLVESIKTLAVTNAKEFLVAQEKLETIRKLEKELEAEYKSHPIIVEAKKLQSLKGDIAKMLEDARKNLKNGPMLTYELIQEEKRQAEERRIAAALKKKADEEAAALAEIERKKAEAARAEAARAKARGDAEAERIAKEKQEAAKIEAMRIKEEAKKSPPPTVIIPKTVPTTKRQTIRKFRIVNPGLIRSDFLMPDEVKIGKIVRALGKQAELAIGGIEVYEETV